MDDLETLKARNEKLEGAVAEYITREPIVIWIGTGRVAQIPAVMTQEQKVFLTDQIKVLLPRIPAVKPEL